MLRKFGFIFVVLLIQACVCFAAEDVQDVVYETRALWVISSDFDTPDEAADVVDRALAANMNVLIPHAYCHGYTTYKSSFVPMNPAAVEKGYDPLASLIELAHDAGLEVHAWFCIGLLPDGKVAPLLEEHPGFGSRAAGDADWQYFKKPGGLVLANLHDAAYRDFAIDMMTELVSNYDLDGLEYDYIRMAKPSFDPVSESEFKEKFAKPLAEATADELHEWNAPFVEDVVTRASAIARERRPGIIISAAVDPDIDHIWPQGQDSRKWAREGWVDLVFTMDYEMSAEKVHEFESNYAKEISNDIHGAGLAIYKEFADSFPVSRTPKEVLSQIKVIRKLGIKHVALFRHGFNSTEIIEALVKGPFREKAIPYYRKK